RGPDHPADPPNRIRLVDLDARQRRRRDGGAGQRPRRPDGRVGAAAVGLPRRGFRRPRALLPRGDHPVARAAVGRRRPVRDDRGVAGRLRLRARGTPAHRTRADRAGSSRDLTTPTFVLSGPAGTLVAEGTTAGFSDAAAAAAALDSGEVSIVLG